MSLYYAITQDSYTVFSGAANDLEHAYEVMHVTAYEKFREPLSLVVDSDNAMQLLANLGQAILNTKSNVFIPSNDRGINEGYYSQDEIVSLLRVFKRNPDTIQFIADMLEK